MRNSIKTKMEWIQHIEDMKKRSQKKYYEKNKTRILKKQKINRKNKIIQKQLSDNVILVPEILTPQTPAIQVTSDNTIVSLEDYIHDKKYKDRVSAVMHKINGKVYIPVGIHGF